MTQHTIPLQPMRPDAVTVISCGDENFTAPTGVLFRSIMDHAEPGRFYDLIYLHNGIDFSLLEQLCAMAEGYEHISIRTCDIRTVFSTEGLYVENRKDFSIGGIPPHTARHTATVYFAVKEKEDAEG